MRLVKYVSEVTNSPAIVHKVTAALYGLDTTGFDTTTLDDEITTLCVLSTDQIATLIDDGEDEDKDDVSLISTLSVPAKAD